MQKNMICAAALFALAAATSTAAQQANGGTASQEAALAAAAQPAVAPQQGQWESAGTPSAAQPGATSGQATAAATNGFPRETVIAPPQQAQTQAFPSTANGPQGYDADPSAGAGQTQGTPSGNAQQQSLPPPPIIMQAKDVISPFTPAEIRELHRDFDETRKAKAQKPVTVIPRISSISVDLSPGSTPPIVRSMQDEPTTLVFFDSTGAPWPLAAVPRMGSNAFAVQWLKGTPDVVITAESAYESTGMAVFLEGLATPIMIKLTSGEPDSNAKVRYVDYRLDLRIPGRGPNAKAPLLGPGRIGMYNDALQGFLDGTPPSDAKTVRIEGEPPAHTVVWQMGDSLYLRTPLEIRSAFDQTMSSADGMHVYKLAPTPLVTVSEGGQDVSLMLDIE